MTALKRNLRKYLTNHEHASNDKASIDDLQVPLEAMENLSMDEVMRIAEKASAEAAKRGVPKEKNLAPMDRAVLFLQQE